MARTKGIVAFGMVLGLLAGVPATANAASPYTQRTTYHVSLSVNESEGNALFDDSVDLAEPYRNGYTFINDYHATTASDQQFFAPGNRTFKLDISGQASESAALSCGMYGGKDSSLSTSGAPFFQSDTTSADASLKCATSANQLYELTYTDCISVTRGTTAEGKWTYTFSAPATCVPVIKSGRKSISTTTGVPFSVTAEQIL